jgi:hypothetical protein
MDNDIKIKKMRKLSILAALILASAYGRAQILHPVKWSYGAKRLSNTEAVVFLKATIDDGWHLYSQTVPDGGPVKTSFTFKPSDNYTLAGNVAEPKPISKYETVFSMNVGYFAHEVIFQQKIKLKGSGPVEVKGSLEYMTCNDKQCLPPEDIDFDIPLN